MNKIKIDKEIFTKVYNHISLEQNLTANEQNDFINKYMSYGHICICIALNNAKK